MRWKADFALLFAAMVWGTGFVVQRLATAQISTFYFNGGRFLLAALIILPAAGLRRGENHRVTRAQVPWMILAGGLLFAAAGFQQAGLATTTVGNASFITGLYVVLVPLILSLVWKKRVAWLTWLAVLLAVAGVMLLSLQGALRLAPGDALELAGAVLWALHILLVGRLAGQGANVLWFSVIQFATCGLLSLALALAIDPGSVASLVAAWEVVVYSAILPIGVGFSLQIVGQKHAPAVDAAIILSTEAVFATLFGYLFLNELLTGRQLFGCALILVAMVMAQMRPIESMQPTPA